MSLLRCIEEFSCTPDKLEVIVIDDGSRAGTAAVMAEEASRSPRCPIHLVRIPPEEVGRGKGVALNRRIEQTAHEVIAVYDADNRPEKGSLWKRIRPYLSF